MEDYIKNLSNSSMYKNDYILANKIHDSIVEWEPETLTDDITGGLITIIAPTGSGKSVLLKHIVSSTHKKFEEIYLICPTAKLQKIYDWMPDENIIDNYDKDFMSSLWTRKKLNKEGNVLVIIDDSIDDPNFRRCKVLDEIAHGGRHASLFVIILSQDFNSIKMTHRKNARISISFQLPSKREREKFTETYMSLENNHIGEILYKKITGEKYQCVACLNYKVGSMLSEKIKKFTADPAKKVVLKKIKKANEYNVPEQKIRTKLIL